MNKNYVKLVLYAISLAMGVSGAVLTALDQQTVPMLLGIGISCLAAAQLGEIKGAQ
jgi:cytochrome b561